MKPEARFTILQSVGRDEVGEVFQSVETASGELAAVKVLDAWTMQSSTSRDDYLNAIKTMHAIGPARTPRPIAIHLAEDTGWIATEWLPSDSLETLGKRIGKFEPEIAAGIACGILDALQEFHDAGLPHGSLTPGKIHLTQAFSPGGVVVTDPFQHVLYRGESPLSRAESGSSRYFGAPKYLSPEQARGEEPDIRSDIYAIGSMLFEMLAGEPAFGGTPLEILKGQVNTPAPMVADKGGKGIPEDLEYILSTALAKDPAARFQSPIAMRRALAHCRTDVDEDAERAAAPLSRSRGDDITALFMTKVDAIPGKHESNVDDAGVAAAAAAAKVAADRAAETSTKQAADNKASAEKAAQEQVAVKAVADAAAAKQAEEAAARSKSKSKSKKKSKSKTKAEQTSVKADPAPSEESRRQQQAASSAALAGTEQASATWFASGKDKTELEKRHGEEEPPSLVEINQKYERLSAVILLAVTALVLGGFLAMYFLGSKAAEQKAEDQKASQDTSQEQVADN